MVTLGNKRRISWKLWTETRTEIRVSTERRQGQSLSVSSSVFTFTVMVSLTPTSTTCRDVPIYLPFFYCSRVKVKLLKENSWSLMFLFSYISYLHQLLLHSCVAVSAACWALYVNTQVCEQPAELMYVLLTSDPRDKSFWKNGIKTLFHHCSH